MESRELDAAVAEALGWTNLVAHKDAFGNVIGYPPGRDYTQQVPAYSSTWEGAGLLIAALRERGFRLVGLQEHWTDRQWECVLDGWKAERGMYHARGETMPRAVSLAALEALGKAWR